MSRPRRDFDREFRDGAVRIVEETGRPVAHVARELGVNEGKLGNWVRQDAVEQTGGLSIDERAELVRLRRRVAEPGDGARCPQTIRGPVGERGNAVTAEFIAAQRTGHGVPHAVSLRALDVAPSTFYKHLNRPPTDRQLRRQALDAEVKRAFDRSQGTCGSPRVTAQLRRDGVSVSNKTVEASMARQGLRARPKKKKGLTGQNPGDAAPTGLLRRDFGASGVNQKQFGDFKEVKTAEGPVFLATVLDLCSRRMVGFATSDHYPTAELATPAVNTAVATRGGNVKGVIFHSDKASQYTAGAFAKACRRLGIARSSGRTGNALDNAPAESLFSTLTHELIDRRSWATKAQARQEIARWVCGWYNHHRLHSAIGKVPPVEHEHAHTPDPHNQTLHD